MIKIEINLVADSLLYERLVKLKKRTFLISNRNRMIILLLLREIKNI